MTESAETPHPDSFGIVGAGLAGALMGCCLAHRGQRVTLYERRPDPRADTASEGRSINLALSHRGLRALDRVGLAERVLADAIPMRGRMMHAVDGDLSFQPYGTEDDQVIYSVSRGGLNRLLIDEADRLDCVTLAFEATCRDVDLESATLTVEDASGASSNHAHWALIGADGAFSAVRAHMQRRPGFDYEQSYLTHGYKELTIPPTSTGEFALEPNALHIWPRGGFMMIALPNADRSYTCTLFWPMDGPNSFARVGSEQDLVAFFEQQFADALPLIPDLEHDYHENPTGTLVTIRCSPWHVRDRVVLIGDAAHAIVPFYGQGMNASFEDCRILDELMREHDLGEAFSRFSRERKPDADALADLAIENFLIMRDRVASQGFLIGRALGRLLHKLMPRIFLPLYTMVTFTSMPYADAVARWNAQGRWLRRAGWVSLVVLALALWLSSR